MTKIIGSPGKYIQGSGELSRLYQNISPICKDHYFLVADGFINDTYAEQFLSSLKENNVDYAVEVFGGECSNTEIQRISTLVKSKEAGVIIGIGGGKTLDTAKAVAFYSQLPVVICPTIASTDAPCSALSVVYYEDGQFDRYLPLPKNPDVVLVDTDVILKAPVRFLVAGIGDAMATYFEARACVRTNAIHMQGGNATNAAYVNAERCYEILLEDGYKAVLAAKNGVASLAVENIIEANTYLSGIGFESCGLAAAHAVHNGMTALPETHNMMHGEKVAFGTLVQLALENAPLEEIEEVLSLCKQTGLPTNLAMLGVTDLSKERLMPVAEAACSKDDTMGNMPFPVSAEDVYSAMLVANSLGS